MRDEGGVDFFKNDLQKEKDRMIVAEILGLKDELNHLKGEYVKEKITPSNRKVLFDSFGRVAKQNKTASERWMHGPMELMHRSLASLHLHTGSRIDLATSQQKQAA